MKSAIRLFALIVALAGLASAAFSPAATHAQPRHISILAGGPITADMPAPPPCVGNGTCAALAGSNISSDR